MGVIDLQSLFGSTESYLSQATDTVTFRMQANSDEVVFNLSWTDVNNILNSYLNQNTVYNPSMNTDGIINFIKGQIQLTVPQGFSVDNAIYFALYELYYAAQDNQSYSTACMYVLNLNTTNNAGTPSANAPVSGNQGGITGLLTNAASAIQKVVGNIGINIPSISQIETILIVVAVILLFWMLTPFVRSLA